MKYKITGIVKNFSQNDLWIFMWMMIWLFNVIISRDASQVFVWKTQELASFKRHLLFLDCSLGFMKCCLFTTASKENSAEYLLKLRAFSKSDLNSRHFLRLIESSYDKYVVKMMKKELRRMELNMYELGIITYRFWSCQRKDGPLKNIDVCIENI